MSFFNVVPIDSDRRKSGHCTIRTNKQILICRLQINVQYINLNFDLPVECRSFTLDMFTRNHI